MRRWTASLAALAVIATAAAGLGEEKKKRMARALRFDVEQATILRVPGKKSAADERLRLLLRVPMPSPGWKLITKRVGRPDAAGRIRVDVDATRLNGAWPAVITKFEHEVEFADLLEGTYLLDIWVHGRMDDPYRAGAGAFQALAGR